MKYWARITIACFAALGLLGAIPVSVMEFNQTASCPSIGPVPICYLVTAGYLAVFVSVVPGLAYRPSLMFVGWLTIFLFAFVGSMMELAGYGTCPKTADGWPKCFFSLLLALAVITPWLVTRRKISS